jgi:gamma-glutamylputrescine oxidase
LEPQFSYWERTTFIDDADVIIIGSGIVGLSAALKLKKLDPALKVLVLERGFLPSGASTKNAGFACFGTVSEQLALLEHSSEDEVARLVNYKWRGLKRLRQNLGDNPIEYYQYGGYELFFDEETDRADECMDQMSYLNKLLHQAIGSDEIYSVATKKIPEFGFNKVSRMIYNTFEGQINTGKMMRALLQKVYDAGILVLNSCAVMAIEQQDKGIYLKTSQGNFKTGKIILATNAFANQLFPELKVIPGRGQVLLPGQPFEIDYWWSGIMGFGDDITPIVKQVEPNVFCAVRCNGMGVAMGSLVGEEVAELAFTV